MLEKNKKLLLDILKWITLIPIFFGLTYFINIVLDSFFRIFCPGDNIWIDVDCNNFDLSTLGIIWLDTLGIFFSLWLSLKFIGKKYYRSATMALLICRVFLMIVVLSGSSLGFSFVGIVKILISTLPTIMAFGYVISRGFSKNDWGFLE